MIATRIVPSKPTGVKQLKPNKIDLCNSGDFFLPYDFRMDIYSLGATPFELLPKPVLLFFPIPHSPLSAEAARASFRDFHFAQG